MENSKPKFTATMTLPKNGKQDWSNIMYGETTVPSDMDAGSPIVMASAIFEDGTSVLGGVLKSNDPTDYNIKFMWVFDNLGINTLVGLLIPATRKIFLVPAIIFR